MFLYCVEEFTCCITLYYITITITYFAWLYRGEVLSKTNETESIVYADIGKQKGYY